jgi:N-acetylmuramoyl-L-alanine amidase
MNTKKALILAAFLSPGLCLQSPARAALDTEAPLISAGDEEFSAAQTPPAALIIDPGHGGDDLGAVVGGRREKDIALAIARRLRARLEALGAGPVRMTRDSDFFVPLDERVDDSLEWSGRVFVSLHLNQVRAKRLQGITVYAFGKEQFKSADKRRHHNHRRKVEPLPAPPKELARSSALLANSIVDSLRHQGFRVDPPAKAGFYVLKNPGIPSVLIELGYLSNPQEATRLNDPAYQDKLAQALAASLQPSLAKLP